MFVVVISFFVMSRSFNNGRSYGPTIVVLFAFLGDLSWKHFTIHRPIVFDQYVRFFEIRVFLGNLIEFLYSSSDFGVCFCRRFLDIQDKDRSKCLHIEVRKNIHLFKISNDI